MLLVGRLFAGLLLTPVLVMMMVLATMAAKTTQIYSQEVVFNCHFCPEDTFLFSFQGFGTVVAVCNDLERKERKRVKVENFCI